MLIEKLTFENFLSFNEIQEIKFNLSKDNITIIIAPMNSGKTSVIRGLEFLFYGKVKNVPKEKLVNFTKILDTKKNETFESSIKCKVRDGKKNFTIERVLIVEKTGKGLEDIDILQINSKIVNHGDEGDTFDRGDLAVNARLNSIIPKTMFDFFFFKGEELANKLLHTDTDLVKGLKKMLYQNQWDEALSSMSNVKTAINRSANKIQKEDNEYKNKIGEKDACDKQMQRVTSQLEDLKEKENTFTKEYKNAEKALDELLGNNNEGIQAILIEKRKRQEVIDRKISNINSQRRTLLGSSGFICLLKNSAIEVKAILEDLHKQRLLPSEISESLLVDILQRGKCICNECCDESTPKAKKRREKIEEFRERSFSADINQKLYSLHSFLDKDNRKSLWSEIETFQEQLEEWENQFEENDKALEKINSEIQQYENQYNPEAEKEIAILKTRREQLKQDRDGTIRQISDLERGENYLKDKLKRLDKEIRETYRFSKEILELIEANSLAETITTLLTKAKATSHTTFFRSLNDNVSALYNEIVTDNSTAIIDSKTLLPSIERGGVIVHALGGGQQQTLVLSYLIALSKLRTEINKEIRKWIHTAEVSEQCFFMDSVFAPMEEHYRRPVAKALPGKIPQFVLLVATQQWDEGIAKGLKGHITDTYFFELNSQSPPEDSKVSYFGKKYSLYKKIGKDKEPFTKIVKL